MLTGRDMSAEEAERIGLVSSVDDDVVAAAVELGQRIAAFSQPGIELTKKSLHAGQSATSLETYLPSEGLGQLYLRLLTGNFEEATLARKDGRPRGLHATTAESSSAISPSGSPRPATPGWTSPTTSQPRCR